MDSKNRNLPAIRVTKDERDLIRKAATKDCRSVSSYILINILKIAKDDLK